MTVVTFLIALVGFIVGGAVLGCLLTGIDRIITARMQSRVGPPLLQPYYDVRKLLAKDKRSVNDFQGFYVLLALLFAILAGAFFFAGGNLLLVVFVITLSTLFFIVAAYSTRSPYAEIGAEREIMQVASYEPMVILFAIAFYIATGSFNVSQVFELKAPIIAVLPLIFLGLLFILTIKLRKSPFDLSYSHHAHQELVKGISTEMSGRTLALVEIMHWYENVLFLGWMGLFVVWASWLAIPLAILAVVLIYFLEILIDNNFARVKWQSMFKWSWIVTLVLSFVNIIVLGLLPGILW
ncbi:MAG: NADH-quinone oxidoreductase subunit H [Coriobacteriia bacterium]|nr:NADH-quinone oxidoreductase subunit H [Coriobacteriia bacterium]MDR2714390.1 NADH-quinone oxidoreductase subunit H [Coriobacteriales bacterium]